MVCVWMLRLTVFFHHNKQCVWRCVQTIIYRWLVSSVDLKHFTFLRHSDEHSTITTRYWKCAQNAKNAHIEHSCDTYWIFGVRILFYLFFHHHQILFGHDAIQSILAILIYIYGTTYDTYQYSSNSNWILFR